jgi:uncharacterized membrane protein
VAALGIYGTFFYERTPDLTIEILSSASVLDVRENLTKLSIVYDGTNLEAANQNLHLLVLRFVNRGSADILKSHFDESAPLGFKVNTGKIVEAPRVVGDAYIQANLKALVYGERMVQFSPVILNAGESFQVRVLLLVPNDSPVEVSPIGKIAGVHKISILQNFSEASQTTYTQKAFGGGFLVQLGRLGGYFVVLVLTILLIILFIVMPLDKVASIRARSRRVKMLEQFKTAASRKLTLKEEYLGNQFVEQTEIFAAFARLVNPGHRDSYESIIVSTNIDPGAPAHVIAGARRESLKAAYDELERNGLVIRDGPQIQVSADIAETATELVNFVSPPASDINEDRPSDDRQR